MALSYVEANIASVKKFLSFYGKELPLSDPIIGLYTETE
jgi:hypothetical protein